jgi:hypothetical protein
MLDDVVAGFLAMLGVWLLRISGIL